MNYIIDKLREFYEQAIEEGIRYDGNLTNIDYYSLFCKAASKNQLKKLMGNNLCLFQYNHEGKESIMIIFSVPLNSTEETGMKTISERVLEIISNMEKCFIEIDKTIAQEVKEDKFLYLTFIKKIEE